MEVATEGGIRNSRGSEGEKECVMWADVEENNKGGICRK